MKPDKRGKKHIAVNTQLISLVIIFFMFALVSLVAALENKIVVAIVCGIMALFIVYCFMISPMYVVFDDNGVKIVYNFGQHLNIAWCEVRSISLVGSVFVKSDGLPRYVIFFPQTEKKPFFVAPEIPKTFKTKRLIKRYYKKDIV